MSYNESRRSNSNYPPMSQAEWDNAPFNQPENDEKEFDVIVTHTLTKNVRLMTKDYIAFEDDDYIDTSEVDWDNEFDNQHYDIPQLLEILESMVDKEIKEIGEPATRGMQRKLKKLQDIKEDCHGWSTIELEFE